MDVESFLTLSLEASKFLVFVFQQMLTFLMRTVPLFWWLKWLCAKMTSKCKKVKKINQNRNLKIIKCDTKNNFLPCGKLHFYAARYFQPSLIFAGKAPAWLAKCCTKAKSLVLATNTLDFWTYVNYNIKCVYSQSTLR